MFNSMRGGLFLIAFLEGASELIKQLLMYANAQDTAGTAGRARHEGSCCFTAQTGAVGQVQVAWGQQEPRAQRRMAVGEWIHSFMDGWWSRCWDKRDRTEPCLESGQNLHAEGSNPDPPRGFNIIYYYYWASIPKGL